MNALLIGVLGVTDCYYVGKDVVLVANLAGWTDHSPADDHYLAAIALFCVLVVWFVHGRIMQHAR
ncbi:MAG TPA: hypothetical protein VF384_08530 [Planctomycetota bacterium]